MCFPAVGAVVGIAQSAVSFAAAQADYNAKAQQWKQNFTNSMAAGVEDQKKLLLRMTQEGDSFAQKQHLANVEGAQAQAEAEASAAAGGVGGVSLDNILVGLQRKSLMNQEANRTNYQNTALQMQAELDSTNTTIENRINSMQKPVAPNPLGYVLSGVGNALGSMPQEQA